MRSSRPRLFAGWVFAAVALWEGAGCHKKPQVEFPRPPASLSIPEKPPPPEPEAPPAEPAPGPSPDSTPTPPAPSRPRPPRRTPAQPAPVEPEPAEPPPSPTPGLAATSEDPAAIQGKISRAETVLATLSARSLPRDQQDQASAARGFIAQGKEALAGSELKRAAVLADKGLILAEDVERRSR